MNRRGTVTALAIAAVGVAGAVPAFAATAKPKPKPLKGTWSYTDTTPDPTVDASLGAATNHCHGKLPASPVDVNSQALKVKGTGSLTVIAHVTGDWAMEIRDAKGNVVTGVDVNPPASESVAGLVLKKGAYAVVLCNLSGAPTATADYSLKYR
jgi:hypothetical protein